MRRCRHRRSGSSLRRGGAHRWGRQRRCSGRGKRRGRDPPRGSGRRRGSGDGLRGLGPCRRVWRAHGAMCALARVLFHRLVDEVIDAALELTGNLLERLPQRIAALKCPRTFLVGVRAHRFGTSSAGPKLPPAKPFAQGVSTGSALLKRRFYAIAHEFAHGSHRLRQGLLRSRSFGQVALPSALIRRIALGNRRLVLGE